MTDSSAYDTLDDPQAWANPARRADLFEARGRARRDRARLLREIGWATYKAAVSLNIAEEHQENELGQQRREEAVAAAIGVGVLEQLADELDEAAYRDFNCSLEELRRGT